MQEWHTPVYYQVTADDAEQWDEYEWDYEGGGSWDGGSYDYMQTAGLSLAITTVIVLLSVVLVFLVQRRRRSSEWGGSGGVSRAAQQAGGAGFVPETLDGSESRGNRGSGYRGSLGRGPSRVRCWNEPFECFASNLLSFFLCNSNMFSILV